VWCTQLLCALSWQWLGCCPATGVGGPAPSLLCWDQPVTRKAESLLGRACWGWSGSTHLMGVGLGTQLACPLDTRYAWPTCVYCTGQVLSQTNRACVCCAAFPLTCPGVVTQQVALWLVGALVVSWLAWCGRLLLVWCTQLLWALSWQELDCCPATGVGRPTFC